MKTIKILFICMLAAFFANAQNVAPFTLEEVAVTPPKFTAVKNVDDQNPLHKFIADNFVYPVASGTILEGTEVVKFVVNPSGKLSDFEVINSVSRDIDKEVIRVMKMTNDMWVAGRQNGIPAAMEREIAIMIKTGETNSDASASDFDKKAEAFFIKGSNKLLVKQKPQQALRNYEVASRYKPYDKSTLTMLAICKLELGKKKSAMADIARIKQLGGINATENPALANNLQPYLKSHEELTALIDNQ